MSHILLKLNAIETQSIDKIGKEREALPSSEVTIYTV